MHRESSYEWREKSAQPYPQADLQRDDTLGIVFLYLDLFQIVLLIIKNIGRIPIDPFQLTNR